MTPFRRLMGLLNEERRLLWMVLGYAIALGVLSLTTPLAIQVLINWLAFGGLLQPVWILAAMVGSLLALAAVVRVLQRIVVESVERRVMVRLGIEISNRLESLNVGALSNKYGPELVNRFFDVMTVQKALKTWLVDGLGAILQAGVGLLLLALYHPALLAMDVALVIAVLFVWWPLGRGTTRTAIQESSSKYALVDWLESLSADPAGIKLSGQCSTDQTTQHLETYLSARSSHFRHFMRQYAGMQLVQIAGSAGLLVLCAALVLQGELTLGQLVASEFVVTSALVGLTKVTEKLDVYYDLLAAMDKLGKLVDLPLEAEDGLKLDNEGPSAVAFDGVDLEFGGPPMTWEIAAGERATLMCDSDEEAVALARSIIGLQTPNEGKVTRDGVPIALLHPETKYNTVALVRDQALRPGSIRENLIGGRADVSDTDVRDVLHALGLEYAIAELPGGLSASPLLLTAAQSRLLLVGRAMVGKPSLLVVDRLARALDPAGRAHVADVLSQLKTTVVSIEVGPATMPIGRSWRVGGLHVA